MRITSAIRVSESQIAIVPEWNFVEPPPLTGRENGLAWPWGGMVSIRTGAVMGEVEVAIEPREHAPESVDMAWDEVVEISEHFDEPDAHIKSYDDDGPDEWPALTSAPGGIDFEYMLLTGMRTTIEYHEICGKAI